MKNIIVIVLLLLTGGIIVGAMNMVDARIEASAIVPNRQFEVYDSGDYCVFVMREGVAATIAVAPKIRLSGAEIVGKCQ